MNNKKGGNFHEKVFVDFFEHRAADCPAHRLRRCQQDRFQHGKDVYKRQLYGIETAKRMAQEEARFAKEALGQFGDRATWFLTLTDQTLTRTF